jgi:hypothetical protein
VSRADASGAFVPINSMPSWMQAFAANQAVTVIINAACSAGPTRPDGTKIAYERHAEGRRSSWSPLC